MATTKMGRVAQGDRNAGGWFNTIITTSGTSSTYLLPPLPISHIGASISGTGYLSFSISPPAMLDDNTAVFAQWDGVAQINPAVTGFKATSTSGIISANVTVKTLYAS
jgi:hypothetical protein